MPDCIQLLVGCPARRIDDTLCENVQQQFVESEIPAEALKEIDRVRKSTDLIPAISGENVIHFSAIPWIDFTSLSHARSFSFADSSPKVSFGKMTEHDGVKTMPVSIHVHHGLVNGYHVGLFFIDRTPLDETSFERPLL